MEENRDKGTDKDKNKDYQYEYDHFDLGYGMHYGVHSYFGEHIAFGRGSNMVHIYPYKIFIGEGEETAVQMTPEQQRILRNVMKIVGRHIENSKLKADKEKGRLK